MIAQPTSVPETTNAPKHGIMPMYRILGTLGMLGSPFLLLSFAPVGFQQNEINRLSDFFGLVFVLGWFSIILGLWTLRAAGTRLPSKILLGLELASVTLAGVYQVYEFVAPRADTVVYGIASAAWPLGMMLMIVIGIAVLRAHIFRGWARFVPLACGLWFPLLVVSIKAAGATPALIIGGIYVMVGWLLLGYVIQDRGNAGARG